MTEQTTEKKMVNTRTLTFEEIKALVNDYGVLKLAGFPSNTNIVCKLVGQAVSEEYQWEEETKVNHYLPIEYKDKNMAGWAPLKLQVGESAMARLLTKFPNNTYIGMMAYASKTAFQGKFPQHINPFTPTNQMIDKNELFATNKPLQNAIEDTKQAIPDPLGEIIDDDTPSSFAMLPDAERNLITGCKILVEIKRETNPNFKGLNAEQWTKLLIRKGITPERTKQIVTALPKDLEVTDFQKI